MTVLAGKNVLITGAANGIGRLLAERIAAESGHVILWDIDGQALRDLSEQLKAKGHRSSSYLCDVGDREAVYARAERVLEQCVRSLEQGAQGGAGRPVQKAVAHPLGFQVALDPAD